MDNILDIFNGDAFSNVSLTNLVNQNFPYVPGFLSSLGLAPAEGVMTLDVAFDEETGTVDLISTSPRGAPPSQAQHQKAKTRKLSAVHLAREVHVNADELLAARMAGTLNTKTLQDLIRQRVDGPVGMKVQLSATVEHMLLGAVQGVVYDADNSTVLYDYYSWLGVSAPTAVNIALSTTTSDSALITAAAMTMRRTMVKALNGMMLGAARPVALCGDNFFDALVTSKEVVTARKTGAFGQANAQDTISQNFAYDSLRYAGITWVNYRGSDDAVIAVPTNEARMFMLGVPGLFQTFYAPADTFEAISAVGLPYYLLQDPAKQTIKRRTFELQSNPLIVCRRPTSLLSITKS